MEVCRDFCHVDPSYCGNARVVGSVVRDVQCPTFSVWADRLRDFDLEKTVLVGGHGIGQVIPFRELKGAGEGTIVNLHHEEGTSLGTSTIGSLSGDDELVAVDAKFQIFATHSGQLHIDHEALFGEVDIGVRFPV